jgi:hypothetical protein
MGIEALETDISLTEEYAIFFHDALAMRELLRMEALLRHDSSFQMMIRCFNFDRVLNLFPG